MKVKVVIEVPDEYADPDHETGLTEEGYNEVLMNLGFEIHDVRAATS